MVSLQMNLIGVDHDTTVQAYLERDSSMNLDPNVQILKSLQKLGYYNINVTQEQKTFLIEHLCKNLKLELTNNWNIAANLDAHSQILNTLDPDYQKFLDGVNKRIVRSMVLSKYIGSGNTSGFYHALTLDELSYVGY